MAGSNLSQRALRSKQLRPERARGHYGGYFKQSVLYIQIDLHFMKKIPAGAEACSVLVGELDFLKRPVVAFVRLSPAVLLSGLAEVPIATRCVAKSEERIYMKNLEPHYSLVFFITSTSCQDN